MKKMIDLFKNYLLEADMSHYELSGKITLYHYARSEEEEIFLDPARFGESSFSKREKETSRVPRVFFYVDLAQRERYISSGRSLYKVEVNTSDIYNLKEDPSGYVELVRHPTYGLRKQIEWDNLLNKIKENYLGVYYSVPNMDVVAWFENISIPKVSEEERGVLEKSGVA